ncbi:MAG: ATP-dependent DNA helicase RecG [Candidatus Omnitrophica bacterium]|nr:ATP-dependent DNA helicase RecG [Candidatus Omnitrophota bacterium]
MKNLSVSVRYIKGVGPAKMNLLNRIGIDTIEDLLYYFPRRYEDRSNIKSIADVRPGGFETIKVKVLVLGARATKRGMNILQVAMGDSTGVIHATWFNQPYLKDKFKVGQEAVLYGKVEGYDCLRINNPEYEILTGTKEDSAHMGRIVPIYPLTEDLTQRWLRNILKFSVDEYTGSVTDMLPNDIKDRNDLMLLKGALQNAHFPVSGVVLEKARRRLIFDEFFLLQAGIAIKRVGVGRDMNGYAHDIDGDMIRRFRKSLPFEFTNSQEKVIKEIASDMSKPIPMNRLLQGDVGSGKTIVALCALVITAQNACQGALMVPTEILAEQHYKNIETMLKNFNIKPVLLSGDLPVKERDRRRRMIEAGEADIIVGTHALIQQGVRFKKLALAVIDEQHKFGVTQRALLRSKSINPDILVMTATPIPRTLALTVYGDLDISTIDELPPGRGEIKTFYFQEKNRQKAYGLAEQQVKMGRQAYVVYPIIEESEKSDLRAAVKMCKELAALFPELKVGLLHGRMNSSEKGNIMGAFKQKKIDILVSTVVIEVGVDISNASVMIIEHAERFGLSQLHQLRGRIGRGKYLSYCVLVAEPNSDEARCRVNAMLDTQDGFKIAEKDLEIRGPGEFFGTKQHGLPELKIGNIVRDRQIMEIARKEAFELIEKDRFLKRPENKAISDSLRKKFDPKDLALSTVA